MNGPDGPRPRALPARMRRREPLPDGTLRAAAPAKINLDLHVGCRRADGYHPLDSIVAKVTLYDDLLLRPRGDGEITLRTEGADCGPDEQNLALRAARLLADAADPPCGADIHLAKSIPPGRGLGGGSSDAAAVLDGLNELWQLGLDVTRLAELGALLGSDVPLFLGPAAARMTGRGERIAPAAVHPFVAVLYLPEFACATGEVYRAFDRLRAGGEQPGEPARPDLAGQPPETWRGQLTNDLTDGAFAACDDLRRRHGQLAACLPLPIGLTGSGSAMFVICRDQSEAASVLRRLPADLPGRCAIVQPNPW